MTSKHHYQAQKNRFIDDKTAKNTKIIGVIK
jgi:hypothetical protein